MQTTLPQTLASHLKRSVHEAFNYLRKEAEGVTPEDARLYATANWPVHKYGIGQDGSISGIVYHVAAWKVLTLPLFMEGGTMLEMSAFRTGETPSVEDYPALLDWFVEAGEAWNAALDALAEKDFLQTRQWGSTTVTLAQYVEEMGMHDIQHAAQIEYLKQRILVEKQ